MSSDTPTDGRCNATTRDGGYCQKYPVDGANRCRLHTDQRPAGRPAGQEQPDADPADVLAHLATTDPDAHAWVIRKYESYLEAAPFDEGSAKADQLKQIAAREVVLWNAIGTQLQEGVVVRDADHQVAENPVNRPLDRLARTVTRRLKELGVLNQPDRQQAAATADRVHALRRLMTDLDEPTEADEE